MFSEKRLSHTLSLVFPRHALEHLTLSVLSIPRSGILNVYKHMSNVILKGTGSRSQVLQVGIEKLQNVQAKVRLHKL